MKKIKNRGRCATVDDLRRIMTRLRNGSTTIRKIISCESRTKTKDGLAFLLSLKIIEKVNEGKFVVYRLRKEQNRDTMRKCIQELYFGNYGLEDLKHLSEIRLSSIDEHLEKMNYRMHLIFSKYTESCPIMFGTGKYKLSQEEMTMIEEDVL